MDYIRSLCVVQRVPSADAPIQDLVSIPPVTTLVVYFSPVDRILEAKPASKQANKQTNNFIRWLTEERQIIGNPVYKLDILVS